MSSARDVSSTGASWRGYSNAMSRAFEFAATTAIFVGLGWLVDHWLGTAPAFIIVLSVLGLVGQFARLWYAYDAEMRDHERALPSSAGAQPRFERKTVAPLQPVLPSVAAQVSSLVRRKRSPSARETVGKS
jgi:hypothetical protein